MLKVKKYSTARLLKYVSLLDNRVYLIFYDLYDIAFQDTIYRLSSYMEIIKTKTIVINKVNHLVIFCYLDIRKFSDLVSELDRMDISEFDISEYSSEQEALKTLNTQYSGVNTNLNKMIYVNKDEVVIQLYNFL